MQDSSRQAGSTEPAGRLAKLEAFLGSRAVQIALIILVALLCYSNSFQVPFLFDDEGSIQLNQAVHGLANFFQDGDGYRYLPNRALGYLSFAVNYQLGGLNVAGYHLVNLAIHIGNALLVYALVALLPRTPAGRVQGGALTGPASRLPFVVALLFVSHPLQTQAVTYIVQRLTLLATFFYLATLVLYLRWRLARTCALPLNSPAALFCYLLALAAAVLAMKCKEIAFTLPFMVLLLEVAWFGRPTLRQFAAWLPLSLTALIVPLTTYGTFHKRYGEVLSDVSSAAVAGSTLSRWEYLCTQFSAVVSYLRLLVLPVGQSLDHDYPVNHSLWQPRPLLSLLLLIALLAAAACLWRASRSTADQGDTDPRPLYRLASFGILWFFIALSIESSIIPIADVMVEHRVYLPSIGFFLALTAMALVLIDTLQLRIPRLRQVAAVMLTVVVLALTAASYARNSTWGDWVTIWQDTVKKSPSNPRAHNILGIGYLNLKNYPLALSEFQKAVELAPGYTEACFNQGLVLRNMERHAESIAMYKKTLGLSGLDAGRSAKIYNELGLNYTLLGDLDRAIEAFGSAVRYDAESAEFRDNYAHVLLDKGMVGASVREFRTVLQTSPGDQRAQEMLREIEISKAQGNLK